MASGWAREGAVQEQIESTIKDAVERARSEMQHTGESLTHCEWCDEKIPEARRKAIPGVRLCITCQAEQEEEKSAASSINRRGSKDSQLR
ncbi:DksA/TraR family C4-type zinc finger protein [Kangiella sediminilitoris]|uniref:Transcriptional regulator, TraR/DksA family n=1 Tax=Kangiella sediminilitoris TaxID=1144748 RepID=A0A1B3B9W6_9GAMM|nr:DksA/TraR family C4-type zinc finger protein [Kangiella sediminilitoris]AOE49602.1 Transcriptional regulator, TraR/DksA family [Kangiella sediminilitoris]